MAFLHVLISVPDQTVAQLQSDVRAIDSILDDVPIDSAKVKALDVLTHMLNGDIGYPFHIMSNEMWEGQSDWVKPT